jgi:hypothetical protein
VKRKKDYDQEISHPLPTHGFPSEKKHKKPMRKTTNAH